MDVAPGNDVLAHAGHRRSQSLHKPVDSLDRVFVSLTRACAVGAGAADHLDGLIQVIEDEDFVEESKMEYIEEASDADD